MRVWHVHLAAEAEPGDVARVDPEALAAGSVFPRPVMRLAAGPVWLRPAIEQFERQWDRRAGRPAAVKA